VYSAVILVIPPLEETTEEPQKKRKYVRNSLLQLLHSLNMPAIIISRSGDYHFQNSLASKGDT
jgi:hypothetical protein